MDKDISRRPTAEIACTTCPNSLWFENKQGPNCYCKEMYLVVYPAADPILKCEGRLIEHD